MQCIAEVCTCMLNSFALKIYAIYKDFVIKGNVRVPSFQNSWFFITVIGLLDGSLRKKKGDKYGLIKIMKYYCLNIVTEITIIILKVYYLLIDVIKKLV